MSSAALANHPDSAHAGEGCSDLNQVVAQSEQSIVRITSGGASIQFALSRSVTHVAVQAAYLEKIILGLCTEAHGLLGPSGRILIETRGVNDAPVLPPPDGAAISESRARVIVRAQQLTHIPDAARLDTRSSLAVLGEMLEFVGGQLECVALSQHELAYVAYLPYFAPAHSSSRISVAMAHGENVILLVEDEPQVQAVMARILRAFGYSVVTAHNERTALAQAEQHGSLIGLVVSDLVLPGVSGRDLVRRLQKPCERARVLYISGYSPEHVGTLLDGASFLRKPFTAEELLNMVRDLLPSSVH